MNISVNVRKLKAFRKRDRKLRARWTVEMGEDFRVYLDAEAELIKIINEELEESKINSYYFGKNKLKLG